MGFNVADVEKPVATNAEVDESRLDTGFQIGHHTLIDVSDVTVVGHPFHVEFFEDSVLDDRNPAFFRLRYVDEHFLLHVVAFSIGEIGKPTFVRSR